jgi:hypothetical protein
VMVGKSMVVLMQLAWSSGRHNQSQPIPNSESMTFFAQRPVFLSNEPTPRRRSRM